MWEAYDHAPSHTAALICFVQDFSPPVFCCAKSTSLDRGRQGEEMYFVQILPSPSRSSVPPFAEGEVSPVRALCSHKKALRRGSAVSFARSRKNTCRGGEQYVVLV